MRYLLAALALLPVGVHAAAFDSTTKGRIVLSCDGVKVSEHIVEMEATAAAINHASSKGGKAICILVFPQKTLVIALPQTAPATGSATLIWTAPTQNTDGSALTDLAGYRVHYGTSPDALTNTIQVGNVLTHTINNLQPGTWYFAVRAYTTDGADGEIANAVSKIIG